MLRLAYNSLRSPLALLTQFHARLKFLFLSGCLVSLYCDVYFTSTLPTYTGLFSKLLTPTTLNTVYDTITITIPETIIEYLPVLKSTINIDITPMLIAHAVYTIFMLWMIWR